MCLISCLSLYNSNHVNSQWCVTVGPAHAWRVAFCILLIKGQYLVYGGGGGVELVPLDKEE